MCPDRKCVEANFSSGSLHSRKTENLCYTDSCHGHISPLSHAASRIYVYDQKHLEGPESLKIPVISQQGDLRLQSQHCPLGAWIPFSELLCRMRRSWNPGLGKATVPCAARGAFLCTVNTDVMQ